VGATAYGALFIKPNAEAAAGWSEAAGYPPPILRRSTSGSGSFLTTAFFSFLVFFMPYLSLSFSYIF
jgi:hypothetical protein